MKIEPKIAPLKIKNIELDAEKMTITASYTYPKELISDDFAELVMSMKDDMINGVKGDEYDVEFFIHLWEKNFEIEKVAIEH